MVYLPNDSERVVILGQTGTGKSVAGAWHLSRRSFDKKPWIVLNPKRDALLDSIGAEELALTDKPPIHPGIYQYVPVPNDKGDDELVNRMLSRVIANGMNNKSTGLYFDEGYSIPERSRPFRQILTQGRSLKIPAITLSQRPVWMDKFVWSETNFIQYFFLLSESDQKIAHEWLPRTIDVAKRLPRRHSHYYDVARDKADIFSPVPPPDTLRQLFRDRLKKGRTARTI